jgi:tetratricopeptide (TPR) repeat protein
MSVSTTQPLHPLSTLVAMTAAFFVGLFWWGCASDHYADIRRFMAHEEYQRAQSQIEQSGPSDAEGWALLAECRMQQENWLPFAEAARKSLDLSNQMRVRIDYDLHRAFIEQLSSGIRAYEDGNDLEAVRRFNQLLVYFRAIVDYSTPEMKETAQRITALAGTISIRLRDFPNARSYLEGLRSDWQDKPELLERLALVYLQMGEPQSCIAVCESALVRDPASTEVLNLRAEAFQTLGRNTATINAYRDALELSPASAILHRNLGILLFSMGGWKEARGHLEAANRLGTADSLNIATMIAQCLFDEGDITGALRGYESIAKSDTGNADITRAIGACYRNLGNRLKAEAAFREARRLELLRTFGASDSIRGVILTPSSASGAAK